MASLDLMNERNPSLTFALCNLCISLGREWRKAMGVTPEKLRVESRPIPCICHLFSARPALGTPLRIRYACWYLNWLDTCNPYIGNVSSLLVLKNVLVCSILFSPSLNGGMHHRYGLCILWSVNLCSYSYLYCGYKAGLKPTCVAQYVPVLDLLNPKIFSIRPLVLPLLIYNNLRLCLHIKHLKIH